MTFNDLFDVFNNYDWNHSQTNINDLDLYFRALHQSMLDHAEQPMSGGLVLRIFKEAEFYPVVAYDPAWEKQSFTEEEVENEDRTFADAIKLMQALIVDNRERIAYYEEKQATSAGDYISYDSYKGKVGDWHNPGVGDLIASLEDGGNRDKNQPLPSKEINWYFIPNLLISGIMYE